MAVRSRTGRAFVLEIVRAIRDKVGPEFHLQMKINGVDHNHWLYPWEKPGNTLRGHPRDMQDALDGGKGVDAFHVSSGITFPHPRNPPGDISIPRSGALVRRNVLVRRAHPVQLRGLQPIRLAARCSNGCGGCAAASSSRGSTPNTRSTSAPRSPRWIRRSSSCAPEASSTQRRSPG